MRTKLALLAGIAAEVNAATVVQPPVAVIFKGEIVEQPSINQLPESSEGMVGGKYLNSTNSTTNSSTCTFFEPKSLASEAEAAGMSVDEYKFFTLLGKYEANQALCPEEKDKLYKSTSFLEQKNKRIEQGVEENYREHIKMSHSQPWMYTQQEIRVLNKVMKNNSLSDKEERLVYSDIVGTKMPYWKKKYHNHVDSLYELPLSPDDRLILHKAKSDLPLSSEEQRKYRTIEDDYRKMEDENSNRLFKKIAAVSVGTLLTALGFVGLAECCDREHRREMYSR